MLFKLSLKNMKKSFGDYTIYFLTLILGVAIFYVFNSLDSQEAMMQLSASTRDIIKLMLELLGGVSVFVSVILGVLIVYANNFLIKRRKKEFGIYMTLGMGKGQISRVLFIETVFIGLISLVVGLLVGIFASQGMSVIVAKMFEVNMSKYKFAFSQAAFIKTIVYFGIMYLAVILMNMVSISKFKLIDRITAVKKSETVKIKNPVISVLIFFVSIGMLAYAYYMVAYRTETMINNIGYMIVIGSAATFLFFWSLAGFLLKLVQTRKSSYLKGLNMFVMRQINSKVNTMVVSMTIICLMLFMTIGVLSTGMSMNLSLKADLQKNVPVDINLERNLQEDGRTVEEVLEESGYSTDHFRPGYVQVTKYSTQDLALGDTLGPQVVKKLQTVFKMMDVSTMEDIMKVSEYNKVAELYGNEEISIGEDEYAVVCNYESILGWRNAALAEGAVISLDGKEYHSPYTECVEGFSDISGNSANFGIIVLPDNAVKEEWKVKSFLAADYNAESQTEKEQIESELDSVIGDKLYGQSKITIYESVTGLGAIVTFIAIYLGVIFLISSAAILALKELSDSSDNRERYAVLRKIGTDEKMISSALFRQTAVFFLFPLALAVVHSIFGIKFVSTLLMSMGAENKGESIIGTAVFIVLIYGGYFIATYLGSKKIISEK